MLAVITVKRRTASVSGFVLLQTGRFKNSYSIHDRQVAQRGVRFSAWVAQYSDKAMGRSVSTTCRLARGTINAAVT